MERKRDDDEKLKAKGSAAAGRHKPGAHSVNDSNSDDRYAKKSNRNGSGSRTPIKPGAVASSSERRSRAKSHTSAAGAHHSKESKSSDPVARKKDSKYINDPLFQPDDDNKDDGAVPESELTLQAELVAYGEPSTTAVPKPFNQDNPGQPASNTEQDTNEESTNDQQSKKYNCKLIVVAIILILIGAGVGAYFGIRKTSEVKATTTGGITDKNDEPPSNATDAPSASPVDNIPSAPPVIVNKYPPPNDRDCEKIANGEPRGGFNDTHTSRTIGIFLDVELQDASSPLESHMAELEGAMSRNIIPELVGCTELQDTRRQLASVRGGTFVRMLQDSHRFVIYDGIVTVSPVEGGVCADGTSDPCYYVLASLDLELQGPEYIIPIISDAFFETTSGLKEKLRLGAPFVRITARIVDTTDDNAISTSPSETTSATPTGVLSQAPTLTPTSGTSAPVIAEPAPTKAPTVEETSPPVTIPLDPTLAPSAAPVTTPLDPALVPSPAPAKIPTIAPTSRPTVPPTPSPSLPDATPSPTSVVSTNPSAEPSQSPSHQPSDSPTAPPTQMPTVMLSSSPTKVPSRNPTPAPSASPSITTTDATYFGIGQGLKCPLATPGRLYDVADSVTSVEECFNLCLSSVHCAKFSFGAYDDRFRCMGCSATAIMEPDSGFTAYELAADVNGVNSWNIEVGQNIKCRYDNTRLFRYVGGVVANVDECYEICARTVGCAKFSFGLIAEVGLSCFGCPSNAGTQPENGMTLYEFRPEVTLWNVESVPNMKCPADSTRLFRITTALDAYDCYSYCKGTPGCSRYTFGSLLTQGIFEPTCIGCTNEAILESHQGLTVFNII